MLDPESSDRRRAALFSGVLVVTVQAAIAGLSFIQLAYLQLGAPGCAPACDEDALVGWGTGYQWWAGALVVAGVAWLVVAARRGWPVLPGPVVTIALTLAGWGVVNAAVVATPSG